MKLVFETTTVPPELYYNGQGKCYSESMLVEVPDENVPIEILKIVKGMEHSKVTNITILKENV